MCGIAGVITKTDSISIDGYAEILKNVLRHRGPNDDGMHRQTGFLGVHLRLSIVDIAGGKQPIYNDDRSIGIIYNGEVYNYIELKSELQSKGYHFHTNTDTEVILKTYEAYGTDAFDLLNGMFAFCIWDNRKNLIYLVRDHFGIKPLYIYEDEKLLIFSSELRAILALPSLDLSLNPIGFQDYLTFRYIQAPYTFFTRISRLEAGTYLEIKQGKAARFRYYDLSYASASLYPYPKLEEVKECVQEKFQQAVRSQLMGEVPIGVLLSGGVDSSAIAHYIQSVGANLTTFNIGFPEVNEFEYSREVAKQAGLKHVEIVVTPQDFLEKFETINAALDEPIADPACLPLYCLGEELKKHVTVVLSGEGGDEVFGGYPQYVQMLQAQLPYQKRFTQFLEKSWYFHDALDYLRDTTIPPLHLRHQKYFDEQPLLHGMLAYDMKTWMPENLMMKADKILMAHSLEGRFPFLDRELFEYVATLPQQYKISLEGETKWLLKEIMTPYLPQKVITRPKMGFTVPIETLLLTLKPIVMETFQALQHSVLSEILETNLLRNRITAYYQGNSGISALQVWTWFVMAYWFLNTLPKFCNQSITVRKKAVTTYQKTTQNKPAQPTIIYPELLKRRELSYRFLRGEGIEIGAWSAPLEVPPNAHVKYVDVVSKEEHLRRDSKFQGPDIDIIDDGETLTIFENESLDFIIANHFFEHCLNPLGTLRTHLAKLRKGGILYYAIPDKRFTFDVERPLTTIEHLIGDDQDGGLSSREEHFRSWAIYHDKLQNEEAIKNRIHFLTEHDYRIHFHVWDETTLKEFFSNAIKYLENAFKLIAFHQYGNEVIVILEKVGSPREKHYVLSQQESEEYHQRFQLSPREANVYLNDVEIAKSVEVCASWPKILVLNLTGRCNILCRFCGQTQFYKTYAQGYNLSFIDAEKLQRIFRNIDRGFPLHIDLQGDGEPLIQHDFKDVFLFCREKFPYSILRLCTNGVALTPRMSEFLVANQLGWLNISLNAGSAATHEQVCGVRVFDRVIENITAFQQLAKASGRDIGIGMSYVLARYNLDDVENFVRLCAQLGIKSAGISYMTVNYQEFLHDSVTYEKRKTNAILEKAHILAEELGVSLNLPPFFSNISSKEDELPPPLVDFDFKTARQKNLASWKQAIAEHILPPVPKKKLKNLEQRPMVQQTSSLLRCTYPWDFISIRGDGAAQMCCGAMGFEEGNLMEHGFWDVWNGPIHRFLRRTVNSNRIDRVCYLCPLNKARDVNDTETHIRPGVSVS